MSYPWKIHFALLDEDHQPWEGTTNLARQIEILGRHGAPEFAHTASPDQADAIVFLESNGYKDWRFIERLLAQPLIRRYPARCFAFNYADTPVAFLPGVYVNLPRPQHQPMWTRPGGYYMGTPNPVLAEFERGDFSPRHLFSFRGAASHSLRKQLFARAEPWRAYGPITPVSRWFNHTPEELRTYGEEIVLSRFVLCPRGIGGATHRLFEVMRLARAPVILADDWDRPEGPDWNAFSVPVAESELDRVPAILENTSANAEIMGQLARKNWETWFSPETALVSQLQSLRSLVQARASCLPPDFSRHWRSLAFYRQNGWTLPQRILHRLRRFRDARRAQR